MAFDVNAAYKQLAFLSQLIADTGHIRQELNAYSLDLNNAWSGQETVYLDQTVQQLSRRLLDLSGELEDLLTDVNRAMTEISEEAAASSGG